jgi:hypothetical protein
MGVLYGFWPRLGSAQGRGVDARGFASVRNRYSSTFALSPSWLRAKAVRPAASPRRPQPTFAVSAGIGTFCSPSARLAAVVAVSSGGMGVRGGALGRAMGESYA